MKEKLKVIEQLESDWETLYYDTLAIMGEAPSIDKVSMDISVRDVVKKFVNLLWITKDFLEGEFNEGYMRVECMRIIVKISQFSERAWEAPRKVDACKMIAEAFVKRIIFNERGMFDDEMTMDLDMLLCMPLAFYNIKEGDISHVVDMLDKARGVEPHMPFSC